MREGTSQRGREYDSEEGDETEKEGNEATRQRRDRGGWTTWSSLRDETSVGNRLAKSEERDETAKGETRQ